MSPGQEGGLAPASLKKSQSGGKPLFLTLRHS